MEQMISEMGETALAILSGAGVLSMFAAVLYYAASF